MALRDEMAALLPAWRERVRKLVKESGNVKIDEVTVAQVYGCAGCQSAGHGYLLRRSQ
jgi:hypothetical protein